MNTIEFFANKPFIFNQQFWFCCKFCNYIIIARNVESHSFNKKFLQEFASHRLEMFLCIYMYGRTGTTLIRSMIKRIDMFRMFFIHCRS